MPLGLGSGRGLRITDRNESAERSLAPPPPPPPQDVLLATEAGETLALETGEPIAVETA